MRVAAGVVLIIAAVINLFAGFIYLGGGAMMGSADKLVAMAEDAQKKQGRELTDKQKQDFERWNEARAQMDPAERAKMDAGARYAMIYGLFLLISVGTSIAGAVCLFRQKGVKFIVVASAFALAIELVGCVVVLVLLGKALGATKLVLSAFGIVGGILGLLAARQISLAARAAEDVPPPIASPLQP